MEPALVSCYNHMDIIIAVAVPTQRFGMGVISWGRVTMVPGALLSHKDWPISQNPGGQASLLSVSLSWSYNNWAKIVCQLGVAGQRWLLPPLLMGWWWAWDALEEGWPGKNLGVWTSAFCSCSMPSQLPIACLPPPWHLLMVSLSSRVSEGHYKGYPCQWKWPSASSPLSTPWHTLLVATCHGPPRLLTMVSPKLQCFHQCQGFLGLSEPVV